MINMLPGDIETKYYNVQVSHKDDVVLKFKIDVLEGYEKLAEVLKCRVSISNSHTIVYDGLMKDMNDSIDLPLLTNEKTNNEVLYEITSYLDTSVGNEYQEKQLYADFRWWVEGEEQLVNPPITNDIMNYIPYAVLGIISVSVIIILLKKRKENDDE